MTRNEKSGIQRINSREVIIRLVPCIKRHSGQPPHSYPRTATEILLTPLRVLADSESPFSTDRPQSAVPVPELSPEPKLKYSRGLKSGWLFFHPVDPVKRLAGAMTNCKHNYFILSDAIDNSETKTFDLICPDVLIN